MNRIVSILFLLSCVCVSAQIPPMVQPLVVVQHKIPTPQPIDIMFSPSPSQSVASYQCRAETNGVFWQTNSGGTNIAMKSWPGENYYYARAVASNGCASVWAGPVSHSVWAPDRTLNIATTTNGVAYTNQFYADLTNLPAPSFFRTAVSVGLGTVALQMLSPSLSSPSNLMVEDVDAFPPNAEHSAVIITKTVNVP